ncbi:FCD domain-containing protein [Streptomyces sp. NPDC050528]|uniref:FCD domain-containing protein n=1 Tax=Streptomyces sp. NPDC050528 TaxID=3365623 RepID=UPI0037BC745D
MWVRARCAASAVTDFMAVISLSIAENRTESLSRPGRPAQSVQQHRLIADAVRAGDPEAAARAMHHHAVTAGQAKLPLGHLKLHRGGLRLSPPACRHHIPPSTNHR